MSEDLPPYLPPASELTYEDLQRLHANSPAVEPLMPHINRLAELEKGTVATLEKTVHEETLERNVARPELTPAHHMRHIEVAAPLVPDIKDRPTNEQDLIGEVIEIGSEALGGEKDEELAKASLRLNEERRVVIEDLRAKGVSAETLLANVDRWSGLPLYAFVDKYQAMLNESVDPPRTEQLATKLLQCKGINLLQENSEVFAQLATKPDEWERTVDIIATEWPKLADDFPKELSSELALGAFDYYSLANGFMNMKKGEQYPEYAARKTQINFEAISLIGTAGLDIKNKYVFPGPKDGFISSTAYRLMNGEHVDRSAIRNSIEGFEEIVEELSVKNPELIELSQKTNFSVEKPEDLSLLSSVLRGVDAREDSLRPLFANDGLFKNTLQGIMYDSYHQGYATKIRDHEPNEIEVMASVDAALDFYKQEDGYDNEVYLTLARTRTDIAKRDIQLLLTPSLREYLHDEWGGQEVSRAVYSLLREAVDIEAVVDAQKHVESPLRGMMQIIAQAQPRGAGKSEYFQLIKDNINKLDKNGTPYNSPQYLAEAAVVLANGTDQGKETLAWYMTESVPFAAFKTVVTMRERLVAKGIQDTPSAIYEAYAHDPSLIAEMSQENLESYLRGELAMVGNAENLHNYIEPDKTEEIIRVAHENAESRKDAFRIFLNINEEPLLQAVEGGGQIKSLLDTDAVDPELLKRRGASYVFRRSDVEIMMGNRSYDESSHPLYGSCGYVDRGITKGAYGYGDIILSFKPKESGLSERTTYTPEDSFHGTHRLTETDARALRIIKNGVLSGGGDLIHAVTGGYVEAQISGGINIAEVDEIIVPDEESAMRLRNNLPTELSSKVVPRDSKNVYDLSVEQMAFQPYVRKRA